MDYRKRIKVVAGKRGGQPTIRGLRITVADVLSYLAAGMSEDQILADLPDLQRDDIRAALAHAADRERSAHDPGGLKLLFDENLSHRLVDHLSDVYPALSMFASSGWCPRPTGSCSATQA